MTRFVKSAAIFAGALLLLLLALGAAVKAWVDPNDYKNDIVRVMQVQHQRTLSIPGAITLDFWPRIGANLGRVTLSERNSAEEFAAVDSARFSVALLPLVFGGDIVINRVDVRGMRAKVVRFADGSMNTGDLTSGDAVPGTAPGGGAPLSMAISSIRVVNARLQFEDRKSGRTLEISHLNIESGAIARAVPSRLALSANIRTGKPDLTTALTLTSKFTPDPLLRRVAFRDVDATLDLSFKNVHGKIKGAIDVDLDKDEFAGEFKGRFDDSNFEAKTGLRAGVHHLTLQIDKIDVGRYQNRLVPDARPDDPTPPGPGDAFDLSPLSVLRANGGIDVGELKIGTMHATNVRAALRSVPGRLVLEPIVGNLYQGSGSGAITLLFSPSASTPQITLVQTLKNVQVGALLGDLMNKAPVTGRGDLKIDINTSGASTAQMRQALAGTASLRLADGAIHGINLHNMVLPGKAASGKAANGETTPFSQLNASFTIASGIAHNADLELKSALVSATGAGDINIGQQEIDYTLACTVNATGASMPVRLSGPWDDMAWRVDTRPVSGAAVSQKARDKLKKTIRGLLKEKKV